MKRLGFGMFCKGGVHGIYGPSEPSKLPTSHFSLMLQVNLTATTLKLMTVTYLQFQSFIVFIVKEPQSLVPWTSCWHYAHGQCWVSYNVSCSIRKNKQCFTCLGSSRIYSVLTLHMVGYCSSTAYPTQLLVTHFAGTECSIRGHFDQTVCQLP